MNARIATFSHPLPNSHLADKPTDHPIANKEPNDPNTLLSAPWQTQMANCITTPDALCEILALDKDAFFERYQSKDKFALKVPHAFVAKMKKGDPNDPLLRQILPTSQELINKAGFSLDPLAENTQNPTTGLLHKYRSRVLLPITGACALHCRYCFRQHFDYSANLPKQTELERIIDYINADRTIDEVILSGGDPLSVSNRRLFEFLTALFERTQIRTMRLHTRLPAVLPARIDTALLEFFHNFKKPIVMVLHINHPNELDQTTAEKFSALRQANITLLNQSVLLKGVNDDADTLAKLSQALFGQGVLPYYLHMLDKVVGAAHFEVSEERAIELYWQLLARLSGYLVPKLVQELPNKPYKTPVDIYKFNKIG